MFVVRRLLLITSLSLPLALGPAAQAGEAGWTFNEFRIDREALCEVRDRWINQQLASNPAGTWVPLELRPTDAQLARMGLPSQEVLTFRRYPVPTLVTKDGQFQEIDPATFESAIGPTLTTFAGTGCLGIRPGGWLLLLTGGGIGWCSLAHVYGSPGAYDISTAGHCGNVGDTATVIAAFGNRGDLAGPVLLDFGTFAASRDGGLGNDWALIDIAPAHQGLVSPTRCFWGGPRGTYAKTGALVGVNFPGQPARPTGHAHPPDPTLAQCPARAHARPVPVVDDCPRAGEAIAWGSTHYMFFGAISPGDSGSGANTLAGDTVGATMEAAGIMTHLYIDPLMRQGLGIMGGTRATAVGGTLANGQIVPYPAPAPGLP